jgi:hypothetical protein
MALDFLAGSEDTGPGYIQHKLAELIGRGTRSQVVPALDKARRPAHPTFGFSLALFRYIPSSRLLVCTDEAIFLTTAHASVNANMKKTF